MDVRKILGIAVFASLVGCSNGGSAVGGAAESVANTAENVAANVEHAMATESNGWSVQVENSAIDGRVLHARKAYAFANRGTWFAVDVKCVESNADVGVSIESYEGEPASASPGSAFASNIVPNLFGGATTLPVGRARPAGLEVRALGTLFTISQTFSNRIEMRRPAVFEDVVRLPTELRGINGSEVNIVRVVRDMLPLSLELNNGMGASEIVIDPAPQVVETLLACGGDADLVPAETVARLQAEHAQQQAQEQAAKEAAEARAALEEAQQAEKAQAQAAAARADFGEQCRNHGDTDRYLDGRKVDCRTEFPEETAAFNAEVDAIYAVPKSHGFLCASRGMREDVASFAKRNGLEWARAHVRQDWCGNLVKMDKQS